MIWPDGRKYEGAWLNELCHGEGEMLWPCGKYFQGTWKEGKMHGKGIYREKEGDKMVDSEWSMGVRLEINTIVGDASVLLSHE